MADYNSEEEWSEGSYSANSIYSSPLYENDSTFGGDLENETEHSNFSSNEESEFSEASFSDDSEFSQTKLKKSTHKNLLPLDDLPSRSREISVTIREQASEGRDVMKLIENRFNTFDKNGNGELDPNEFRQLLVSILGGRQVPLEHAEKLLKSCKIDTNNSGTISYDEFVSFVSLEKHEIFKAALVLQKALKTQCSEEDDDEISKTYGRYATKTDNNNSSRQKWKNQTKSRPGYIGREEFRNMATECKTGAQKMTEGELQGFMRVMDTEGLGEITLTMFRDFINNFASNILNGDTTGKKLKFTEIPPEFRLLENFEASPIVELKLSINKEEEEKLHSLGYIRLSTNLNDKGRGKVMYAWYKKAGREEYPDQKSFLRHRITDIALSRRKKDVSLLSTGFQIVRHNTNKGAWFSRKQYIWIRRNAEDKYPLLDIYVSAGRTKDKSSKLWTPPFRGYKRINGDLNKGNNGSQVFLWYFKKSFQSESISLNLTVNDPTKLLMNRVREQLRNLSERKDSNNQKVIDLGKIWESYDKNNRGWLSRSDLRSILKDIGLKLKAKEFNEISRIMDADKNNRIEQAEFLDFLAFNPADIEKIADHVRAELQKQLGYSQNSAEMKSRLKNLFLQFSDKESGKRNFHATNSKRSEKNKNAISTKGFGKVMRKLGIRLTDKEQKSLMGMFDKDSDGFINYKEFCAFVLSRKSANDAAAIRVERTARKLRTHLRNIAFKDIDTSSSGEPNWEKSWHFIADESCRNSDMVTKDRLALILDQLDCGLVKHEIDMLLSRFGKFGDEELTSKCISKQDVIAFASSTTYIDSVLQAIVDFAIQMSRKHGMSKTSLFRKIDKNGDGSISKEELSKGLSNMSIEGSGIALTEKELGLLVQRFDQDGDGKIDLQEFVSFLESQSRAREKALELGLDEDDAQVVFVLNKLKQKAQKHKNKYGDYVGFFAAFDVDEEGQFDIKGFKLGLLYLNLISARVVGVNKTNETVKAPYLSMGQIENAFRKISSDGRSKSINYDMFVEFLDSEAYLDNENNSIDGYLSSSSIGTSDSDSLWFQQSSVGFESEYELDYSPKLKNLCQNLNRKLKHQSAQQLKKTFASADTNGFGTLSPQKFANCLYKSSKESLSRTDAKKIAHKLDQDNGAVNYYRFCNYLQHLKKKDVQILCSKLFMKLKLHKKPHRLEGWLRKASGQSTHISMKRLNSSLKNIGLNTLDVAAFQELNKACQISRNGSPQRSSSIQIKNFCSYIRRCGKTPRSSPRSVSFSPRSLDSKRYWLSEEDSSPKHMMRFESIERKVRDAIRANSDNLKEQFDLLDRNGVGKISIQELTSRLPLLLGDYVQLPHEEVHILLKAFDRNRDGMISLKEFASFLQLDETDIDNILSKLRQDLRSQARRGISQMEIFHQMDKNGDGVLSRREFRLALEKCTGIKLNNSEMRQVLDRFSHGPNGKIDYEMFAQLCFPSDIEVSAIEAKLKERIRKLVCTQSRDSVFDLKNAYGLFDVDGTGVITRREFQDGCIRLGISLSDDELQLLLERFDANNDNKVDYFEFARFLSYNDSETDQLICRAGRRLIETQNQGQDPIEFFSAYNKALSRHASRDEELYKGYISRREFFTACSDLKLGFEESEIFALADMYSETTTNDRVNYEKFVTASFAACGHEYSPQKNVGNEDAVWNPSKVDSWLEHAATEEDRRTFSRIQNSMDQFTKRKYGIGNVVPSNIPFIGRPTSVWNNNSTSHPEENRLRQEFEQTGLWDCPVCFYKQTEPRRKTCTMCDSANPYIGDKLHWPHIKPLITEASAAARATTLNFSTSGSGEIDERPMWTYNPTNTSPSPRSHQTPGEVMESPRWNLNSNYHHDDVSISSVSSNETSSRRSGRSRSRGRNKNPRSPYRKRRSHHSKNRKSSKNRKKSKHKRCRDRRQKFSSPSFSPRSNASTNLKSPRSTFRSSISPRSKIVPSPGYRSVHYS